MKLISYSRTYNLGDAIQTVAMARWLKSRGIGFDGYCDRSRMAVSTSGILVNGWHRNKGEPFHPGSVFAGIHSDAEHIAVCSPRALIGTRDQWTNEICHWMGRWSVMTGCATSSLPPYSGLRDGGVLKIDHPREGAEGSGLTQRIDIRTSWSDQLAMAASRLQMLMTAEEVLTSRLHVALPCIAFGTPVTISAPEIQPERVIIIPGMNLAGMTVRPGDGISEQLREMWTQGFEHVWGRHLEENCTL